MNAESAIYLIFYSERAARKENHVHAASQLLASERPQAAVKDTAAALKAKHIQAAIRNQKINS